MDSKLAALIWRTRRPHFCGYPLRQRDRVHNDKLMVTFSWHDMWHRSRIWTVSSAATPHAGPAAAFCHIEIGRREHFGKQKAATGSTWICTEGTAGQRTPGDCTGFFICTSLCAWVLWANSLTGLNFVEVIWNFNSLLVRRAFSGKRKKKEEVYGSHDNCLWSTSNDVITIRGKCELLLQNYHSWGMMSRFWVFFCFCSVDARVQARSTKNCLPFMPVHTLTHNSAHSHFSPFP